MRAVLSKQAAGYQMRYDWYVKLFKGGGKVIVVSVFYVLSYYFREADVCRLRRSFGRIYSSRRIACGMSIRLPRTVWKRGHAENLTAFIRSCNSRFIGGFFNDAVIESNNYVAWNDWVLVNTWIGKNALGNFRDSTFARDVYWNPGKRTFFLHVFCIDWTDKRRCFIAFAF
jgi:hypothetical protein